MSDRGVQGQESSRARQSDQAEKVEVRVLVGEDNGRGRAVAEDVETERNDPVKIVSRHAGRGRKYWQTKTEDRLPVFGSALVAVVARRYGCAS